MLQFPGSFRVTPLSSLKTIESLPITQLDFSRLHPRATPQEIRDYLAGQLQKEAAPPVQNVQGLKDLMALRNLKVLKKEVRPDGVNPNVNWQKVIGHTNLAASLTKLLTEALVRSEKARVAAAPPPTAASPAPAVSKPAPVNNEKPPQICIQFIDLSSRAVETLLNKNRSPKNQSVPTETELKTLIGTKPTEMSSVPMSLKHPEPMLASSAPSPQESSVKISEDPQKPNVPMFVPIESTRQKPIRRIPQNVGDNFRGIPQKAVENGFREMPQKLESFRETPQKISESSFRVPAKYEENAMMTQQRLQPNHASSPPQSSFIRSLLPETSESFLEGPVENLPLPPPSEPENALTSDAISDMA